MATQGTLNSELFHQTAEKFHDTKIIEQIGHGLVQLIENGKTESAEMHQLLKSYLQPMIAENIDFLVLGCSHYPFLIPQIKQILPENITIIDSGHAVAKQTLQILQNNNLMNNSQKQPINEFYTNSNPDVLSLVLENKFRVEYRAF